MNGVARAAKLVHTLSAITFFARGIPYPQGSKSVSRAGKVYESGKLKVWRDLVTYEARVELGRRGMLPFEGAVELYLEFTFMRPRYHFPVIAGTPDYSRLKVSAPAYHVVKPDLDKLIRAVGDALTGALYWDDRQVVHIFGDKTYTNIPEREGVTVVAAAHEEMLTREESEQPGDAGSPA